MPTYEFCCPADGAFDLVLKVDDVTKPQRCPECGRPVERVYSMPPVMFNCDGFHATDYPKTNIGTGTKGELLDKAWSQHYGEEPPPPAKDVPRNSRNPHG